MRHLSEIELKQVSGAGGCYDPCDDPCDSEPKRRKNNNGYGNGPESGPPPGNSGAHNPQLIEDNRGPRGPR
ncbi:MAG TPA: hypothetical protein VN231_15230 [Allosphingosinicella sp.]|nr:hypothetical protein [Allosphingosinicella sp.]